MGVELTSETQAQLRRYVNGDLSNAELADWLAGAEYDPELPQPERDALARIGLELRRLITPQRPRVPKRTCEIGGLPLFSFRRWVVEFTGCETQPIPAKT